MKVALALALVLAGCAGPEAQNGDGKRDDGIEESTLTLPDDGDFLAEYRTPSDPDFRRMEESLREVEFLEDVTHALNEELALPRDIVIAMEECGEANAFYDPETFTISMCYELIVDIEATFATGAPEDVAFEKADAAFTFVLLHELGHALKDVYGLDVGDREEDAVDAFSAILLIDLDAADETQWTVYAAEYWALSADENEQPGPWDEHSPDGVRAENVLCYVYGSDHHRYGALVDNGWLPATRAAGCAQEFEGTCSTWMARIADWHKGASLPCRSV